VSVDRDQARKIAGLARLRFEEAELERVTAELNHILEHVEALRSLEQRGATPMPEERASTRGPGADQPDTLRGGAQTIAPDWREGFFVVPPLPGVHAEDGA
jgi:aspartyl-tRNA(Asn)/glutamyl-tRNA(Gln) amidotransferase subunit C